MIDADIYEPFEKLVEIEIVGEKRSVPENNTLLRCFQYLNTETVSMGEFCWNGDCSNCQIWLDDAAKQKPALACRTRVREGMKIVRMSKELSSANLPSLPSSSEF